jgi:hypothetical protein
MEVRDRIEPLADASSARRGSDSVSRSIDRPPVLSFLLAFFGLLAIALGLAAASPAEVHTGRAASGKHEAGIGLAAQDHQSR